MWLCLLELILYWLFSRNYWRDFDTALFMLKHLFRNIPEEPDLTSEELEGSSRSGLKVWYKQREILDEELPLTFADNVFIKHFSYQVKKMSKRWIHTLCLRRNKACLDVCLLVLRLEARRRLMEVCRERIMQVGNMIHEIEGISPWAYRYSIVVTVDASFFLHFTSFLHKLSKVEQMINSTCK